jgi:predicted aldo/keto reductase-like oxidoreductase
MRYTMLGRTGLRVSRLGQGTNRLKLVDRKEIPRVLNHLLDRGLNYINTGYGDTQELVGDAIRHRRDEFIISSKCGTLPAEEVRRGIDESRRMLGFDVIDVYEMDAVDNHRSLRVGFQAEGTLDALLEAREAGKIRFLSVTSHRPDMILRAIKSGYFDVCVFPVNVTQPYGVREVIPYARRHKIGTLGIRAISHGALQPADKALIWSLYSGVDVALSGMCSVEEVDHNCDVVERDWSPDDIRDIQAEFARIEPTGCRMCHHCSCPYELNIAWAVPLVRYRERYGLLPSAEEWYVKGIEKAKTASEHCSSCRRCEPMCPYDVPIVELVKEIAAQVT